MPLLSKSTKHSFEKRKDQSVYTRLKLGHTILTHQYLVKREDPPECIPCDTELTVKHILLECVDFALSRKDFFNATTMKALFESTDPQRVLDFLKQISLYDKI